MIFQKFAAKEFGTGKIFMARLPHGEDFLASLEAFCETTRISMAVFWATGALASATLGLYDQKQQVYVTEKIEQQNEIISCSGNISLKNGKPFAHAYVLLTGIEGRSFSGRLLSESKIFTGELYIQELLGDNLNRTYDATTGLMLWDI